MLGGWTNLPVASPHSIVDRIGIFDPSGCATSGFSGSGLPSRSSVTGSTWWRWPCRSFSSPTAGTLAYVGIAWATTHVALSLVSGALSDRIDRRRLLIAGDVIRLLAISAIGAFAVLGTLTIPVLIALVVVIGIGQSAFGPSFSAITPSIVPEHLLVEANGLGQFVRPVALLMLGPLIGGLLVSAIGPGWAFIVDGVTFAWSAEMILAMSVRTQAGLVMGPTVDASSKADPVALPVLGPGDVHDRARPPSRSRSRRASEHLDGHEPLQQREPDRPFGDEREQHRGVITVAFLLVPGALDPERDGSLEVTGPSPTGD
jgi:MFS family permease